MSDVHETTSIKATVNTESFTKYPKDLHSLQTCDWLPRYELLYSWHKRNNFVLKYKHDSNFNISTSEFYTTWNICFYLGQYQIMDLYKNIALGLNKFITFISKKETSELLSFPQNDQHRQTT